MKHDIIGDIHGCAQTLTALLDTLDYAPENGIYTHPGRQAIFLGDFVDRFPYQREVIDIVRPMIESGSAQSVMGNHEYNAICYFTKQLESGKYLREHSEKNTKQHKAFLAAYGSSTNDYADVIGWFKTLPLWLDLEKLKIIHACWDKNIIQQLKNEYNNNGLLTDKLLVKSATKGQWEYLAIETLLKGKEIPLQDGIEFRDKDGHPRHDIRIKWWDQSATTYRNAFMGPRSTRTHIPNDEIDGDHLVEYSHKDSPVFLGHYWMEGTPTPLAKNIACVDYSVANNEKREKLTAYRWDGEQKLSADKFVSVERIENEH